MIYLWGQSRFLSKNEGRRSKMGKIKMVFRKCFLIGIDSEWSKTYSKKISVSKKIL